MGGKGEDQQAVGTIAKERKLKIKSAPQCGGDTDWYLQWFCLSYDPQKGSSKGQKTPHPGVTVEEGGKRDG